MSGKPSFRIFFNIQMSGYLNKQVKLGFTRACRSIKELGKKWLKTRQNWSFDLLKLLYFFKQCKMLKLPNLLN